MFLGKAYRYCKGDGRWETKLGENDKEKGFTHYNNCILPQLLDILQMCEEIKECQQV